MFTNPLASIQRKRADAITQATLQAHAEQVCADLTKDPEAPVRVFDPDAPQLDPARQHAYALSLAHKVRELGPHVEPKRECGVWALEPALAPFQTSTGYGLEHWRCHRCGTNFNTYAAAMLCSHNAELRRNIAAAIFPCPAQPQRINTGNPPESGWQDLEAGFFPPLSYDRNKRLRALCKAVGARSLADLSRVAINIADGLLIVQASDGRCAWETD